MKSRLKLNYSYIAYNIKLNFHRISKSGVPAQCSWLKGTISFAKDDIGRKVESISFKYILTEGPPVKKSNGANNTKETKKKLDEYKEGLRDFKNSQIIKQGLKIENYIFAYILKTIIFIFQI